MQLQLRIWQTPRAANSIDNARVTFISAATWHGTLQVATEMLAAHPELASSDVHTAAILGDDAAVRRFLSLDAANATATCQPYGGNALTHLCLSKYLRLDSARSDAFIRAATALLDAGADPNGGFWTTGKNPEFETPLYGAAGVAHHPGLTRLLLERGADPNDDEACYHSPESDDNRAMAVLVESGRITLGNLTMMLIRKHDWHDYDGATYLLEHGTDPNYWGTREWSPIHHSIKRDNGLEFIELLLDHGADPTRKKSGQTAVELAAWRGRGDVLELFEQRGFAVELSPVDRLIAACARHQAEIVEEFVRDDTVTVREVVSHGGTLLPQFAGTWNTQGSGLLIDLGVAVDVHYPGDPYYDIPPGSTPLQVAAWKSVASTVKLLIDRGADVKLRDANGRTPLMLAVRASVDSYWTHRRTPQMVKDLVAAGADPKDVSLPTGYAEVDALLLGVQNGTEQASL